MKMKKMRTLDTRSIKTLSTSITILTVSFSTLLLKKVFLFYEIMKKKKQT